MLNLNISKLHLTKFEMQKQNYNFILTQHNYLCLYSTLSRVTQTRFFYSLTLYYMVHATQKN